MLLALLLAVLQAGPPAVAGHALVYAGDQGLLLLNADGATGKRIWRWDGQHWALVPGEHPQVHSLAAVAYDPDTQAIFMHGGAIGHPSEGGQIDWKPDASTLRFDGKVWTTVATTGPAPRDHHAMVYDRARKRLVLYGGTDADPSGRSTWFDDTWEWDGKQWIELEGAGPTVSAHFGMAYDEKRERVVLAGGFGQRGPDARVWELDGKRWTPIETGDAGGPALRTSPRMAFDAQLGKVVLFGGESDRVHSSDTWAWDGTQWSRIAAEGPPGRSVHALAYDGTRGVLVMYGGAGPSELDDLWELDGSSGAGSLPADSSCMPLWRLLDLSRCEEVHETPRSARHFESRRTASARRGCAAHEASPADERREAEAQARQVGAGVTSGK